MTPHDETPLIVAARQRTQNTRLRAVGAIRDLDAAGAAVTFNSVADAGDVSRAWLYRQPDIRAEIVRLRETAPAARLLPSIQRATADSTRRRLDLALDEIQRLKTDNAALREQLARNLGAQRATPLRPSVNDMSTT